MSSNFGVTLDQRLNPSITSYDQLALAIMQTLRAAVPAVVVNVNAEAMTVDVQIATKELTILSPQGTPINVQTKAMPVPLLTDVPLAFYNGGGFSLTFPVSPGDEVMLVFSDTSLDTWFQNGAAGGPVTPFTPRRHSLSDAVAYPVLRSTPRKITNFSTDHVQLRSDDGTVLIELKDDEVNITAPTVNVTGSSRVNVVSSSEINLDGSGTTIIDGKNFLTHVHGGVQSGSADTGPVA